MESGVQWLLDAATCSPWLLSVHFARGIGAEELAYRMGAARGAAPMGPMTDAEAVALDVDAEDSAVVRVGEDAGWSFAIAYGSFLDLAEEVSRDGVEAVGFHDNSEHPPTTVGYARDGRTVYAFALDEEDNRYGHDPDLLLPCLVAAGVLLPDGESFRDPDDEDRKRRSLAVVEEYFGLSLPRTVFTEDRLPVHAVLGSPAPDFDAVHAWAGANGQPLPDPRLRLIPAGLRWSYDRAADGRRDDGPTGRAVRVVGPRRTATAVLRREAGRAPAPGTGTGTGTGTDEG